MSSIPLKIFSLELTRNLGFFSSAQKRVLSHVSKACWQQQVNELAPFFEFPKHYLYMAVWRDYENTINYELLSYKFFKYDDDTQRALNAVRDKIEVMQENRAVIYKMPEPYIQAISQGTHLSYVKLENLQNQRLYRTDTETCMYAFIYKDDEIVNQEYPGRPIRVPNIDPQSINLEVLKTCGKASWKEVEKYLCGFITQNSQEHINQLRGCATPPL